MEIFKFIGLPGNEVGEAVRCYLGSRNFIHFWEKEVARMVETQLCGLEGLFIIWGFRQSERYFFFVGNGQTDDDTFSSIHQFGFWVVIH